MGCELMATALRRSHYRLSVVGCEVDSAGALKAVEDTHPHVCIISHNLKDGPCLGFKVARELKTSHPKSRVVLLLDSYERAMVIEAFRSGARGIFSRDDQFEALCKCIHVVHQGHIWVSNKQVNYLIECLAESAPPYITNAKGANLLSKRELGVANLVAEGRTNRDISRALNLSEHTVRNYLFRIFNKLGTSNRLELALYVINQREAARK